jgi:arginine decarboxylase
MAVLPHKDETEIRILDVIEEAKARGLRLPLHIRFQDILQNRVRQINEAFASAIAESGYGNRYRGVFPVKVNQMREVVETLLEAGEEFSLGLEAGSKPELLLALALHTDYESLLICNGYKDEEFLRTAIAGRKLGKKVIVVIEKLEELRSLVAIAAELAVKPCIGVRVKLANRSSGKWATSSGDNAKFGLSTVELLEALSILDKAGLKDCLKLLHFHIGSQIPEIQVVTRCIREGARFYAKLVKMGCSLEYVDIGGGLGVDYDGTRSAASSSTNYSLREYAVDIVSGLKDVCDEEGVPPPCIVSESGRALVAHHSMIAVEVIGKICKETTNRPRLQPEKDGKIVREVMAVWDTVEAGHYDEAFHDLAYLKQQAMSLFDLGYLDLETKAAVDALYWEIAADVAKHYEGKTRIPEDIRELTDSLKDQYLLNFSVFRALPDFWALGQLFPAVPVQRLDERPKFKGTIVDITCDSDGRVDRFIGGGEEPNDYLPLHELNGRPYYLGFFLTGAYQDTLGDMHNLFGRMHEVHVRVDPDEEKGWYIDEEIQGDTVEEVLVQNEYVPAELVRSMRQQIDRAIKQDTLKPGEGMRMLAEYEKSLKRYTYLDVGRS